MTSSPSRAAWIAGGATLAVDGHRIWYRVDGAGPTLIFVHGFPTSAHDWEPCVRALAPRFRCVTFDLLGYGESAKPRAPYRMAAQLRVLGAVTAATVGTAPAVIVAHDYGVTVAQLALARWSPAELALRGTILLNGGIEPMLHRPRRIQTLLASRLGALLGPYVTTRATFVRSMTEILARPERVDLDAMWEGVIAHDGLHAMPRLLAYMAERRELRDELVFALVAPRVPLAFAWGERDPVSGAHVLAWIRARVPVPASAILALPDVGHYPQLEATDAVVAHVATHAARWLT